jgi:hypothetical protein
MVDPRAKGARGETQVRDVLRLHTKLQWERTPGSGALDEKHGLKGDLYIPNATNLYCVEVKNYEEDHLTSHILTSKDPQLLIWWEQAIRQGNQVNRKPLLIFKFNRSKIFVAFQGMPMGPYRTIFIDAKGYEFYVALLEDWLTFDKPKFVN